MTANQHSSADAVAVLPTSEHTAGLNSEYLKHQTSTGCRCCLVPEPHQRTNHMKMFWFRCLELDPTMQCANSVWLSVGGASSVLRIKSRKASETLD